MKPFLLALAIAIALVAQITQVPDPPGGGGTRTVTCAGSGSVTTPSSSFQAVAGCANYTGQSGSLSFNLLDNPVTGDYVLNDGLTITSLDPSTNLTYALTWANDSGGVSNDSAGFFSGESLISISALGNGIADVAGIPPGGILTPPMAMTGVQSGTPIAVVITLTPSAVGTASPTAGNLGLLYAPGDTGPISTGDGTATYQVLTVGAGGTVETVEITNGGATYAVSTGNATAATSGSGTGLELDILTLSTTLQYSYHATLVRNQ